MSRLLVVLVLFLGTAFGQEKEPPPIRQNPNIDRPITNEGTTSPLMDALQKLVAVYGPIAYSNDRPNPYGRPPPRDLDDYFDNFVIGGPGSFYIVAENFQDFAASILNKLIREIAQADPDRPTTLAAAH